MDDRTEEKNIFETLKNIRIQKGISLESISDRYKIQLKYLKAIEKGDMLQVPEVYDKLFFRSYLKALEVEEKEYFEEFLSLRKSIRVDKTTTIIKIPHIQVSPDKSIFSYKNLFVILPIVLIVLLIGILLMNTEIISPSSDGKVQEIDIRNVIQRIEYEAKAKADSLTEIAKHDSVLTLQILAVHKTWFRVISDKSDTLEVLLQAGQEVDIRAEKMFEFLIGRADGLRMTLNDSTLKAAGTDGSVVTYMLIDSTGVAQKVLKTNSQSNIDKVKNVSI